MKDYEKIEDWLYDDFDHNIEFEEDFEEDYQE